MRFIFAGACRAKASYAWFSDYTCRARPAAVPVLLQSNQMAKGDVLRVAQLAGIMGAKQTSNLIPLCHNIFLSKVRRGVKMQ